MNRMMPVNERRRHIDMDTFVSPGEVTRPVEHLPGLAVSNSVEPADLIIPAGEAAQQRDSMETKASGAVRLALPLLALYAPLVLAFAGLAWQEGWVEFRGPRNYLVTCLFAWGLVSLISLLRIYRDVHEFSAPGVERRRIEAQETVLVEKIRSDEAVRIAGLRSYLRLLGVKDDGLD